MGQADRRARAAVQEFGISTEEAFQQLKAMKAKNAETSSAAKASTKMG